MTLLNKYGTRASFVLSTLAILFLFPLCVTYAKTIHEVYISREIVTELSSEVVPFSVTLKIIPMILAISGFILGCIGLILKRKYSILAIIYSLFAIANIVFLPSLIMITYINNAT